MEPKILVQGAFTPDDITVSFSESTRMIDPEVESQLEEIWEKKVEDATLHGKNLYNGLSYRLNSWEQDGSKLHLDFGIIEYKVRDGLIAVPAYLALPEPYWRKGCYTMATIKTSDDKYLMVELSGKSMNTNTVDLIGGIVETEPEIRDGAGVFQSFFAELEEEAFITKDDIAQCVLKAVVQERRGNIGLYFEAQLRVSSSELIARHENGEMELDIKAVKFYDRTEYLDVLRTHNPNKQIIAEIVEM